MTPTLSRPAALEYAIMRTGAVGEIYDTLDQARAALYRTAAPMGHHPTLVQRVRSDVPKPWSPVPTLVDGLTICP
jgi:hypothetical protein